MEMADSMGQLSLGSPSRVDSATSPANPEGGERGEEEMEGGIDDDSGSATGGELHYAISDFQAEEKDQVGVIQLSRS